MKIMEKNGKKIKGAYSILQKTGQGVKIATDAGYKTGYFMAKHPNLEKAKCQIQKNYKSGLIIMLGVFIGLFGIIKILAKMKS